MKKFLRGAAKSKTMWFSVIVSVSGVIQANADFLHSIMLGKHAGYVLLMVGCVSAALRVITKNSLSDKGE